MMPAKPMTLADLFARAEAKQIAVVLPDRALPVRFGTLADTVESLAGRLRGAGLQPGDCIGLALPNGLEFLVAFLAIARARLIAAPLNPALTPAEMEALLGDAHPRALIAPPEATAVADLARRLQIPMWTASRGEVGLSATTGSVPDLPRPDDVALFLHTSGTTGRPKGAPLTHANIMASVGNIASHYRLDSQDTGLVVMPLFHVHGLIGAALAPLFAGGAIVVPPRFSASAFWPTVQDRHVTWYSAVPTIHQILLSRADADHAPAAAPFRFIRSCSAPLAPTTFAQLENRFGVPVLEAYAMTEAAHQMTSNALPPDIRKAGSVGRGTNVDVAIMDEAGTLLSHGVPGEVVVRGPNVTSGYRDNPLANEESFVRGWFRTGDRGVLDEDDSLTLIGRIKEMINRGGEKISPTQVDAVLLSHPAVAEAAAFGVADAKYGEEIRAAVVLKSDATSSALLAYCRSQLADFEAPKAIHVLTSLPKGPTGKINRGSLAAMLRVSPDS